MTSKAMKNRWLVACLVALSGCGDSGGDSPVDEGPMAGTGGGGVVGTGGSGGASGTGGADPGVQQCVDNHFTGVDAACASCMCECDANASQCDELCWQLANCVYFQCQLMSNRGMTTQECSTAYCGRYLDATQGATATALSPCYTLCGGGACVAWWTMQVPADTPPSVDDAGADADAGF